MHWRNAVELRNLPGVLHISTGVAAEICEFLVRVAGLVFSALD
jgi:hypothetical protein